MIVIFVPSFLKNWGHHNLLLRLSDLVVVVVVDLYFRSTSIQNPTLPLYGKVGWLYLLWYNMFNVIMLQFSFVLFPIFQIIFCMLLLKVADSSFWFLASGRGCSSADCGSRGNHLESGFFDVCFLVIGVFFPCFFLLHYIYGRGDSLDLRKR